MRTHGYLYGRRRLQRVREADHAHVIGVLAQGLGARAAEQARQAGAFAAHAAARMPATEHAAASFPTVLLEMNHA